MPVIAIHGQIRAPMAPFALHAYAHWWWSCLREVFPVVSAAVVLPDGFEVVAPVADAGLAFAQLAERAARLTARVRALRPVWRPMAPPRIAADTAQELRWVRELLARPCRLGLVAQPLLWRWSTARDAFGAVCDPWVAPSISATGAMPWRTDARAVGALAALRPQGVAGGIGAESGRQGAGCRPPLAMLAWAAGEATRGQAHEIGQPGATRNVFVWLAVAQGWEVAEVATTCGARQASIARVAATPNGAWLAAATRWLEDPRLSARPASAVAPRAG